MYFRNINFKSKNMSLDCVKIEDVDLSTQILCPCCKDLLDQPIHLPCNNNICKKHVNNQDIISINNKVFFKCLICKSDHLTDSNGTFPLNEKIDDLVKKCQVRATPVRDIHKTANESYDKLKSINIFITNTFI